MAIFHIRPVRLLKNIFVKINRYKRERYSRDSDILLETLQIQFFKGVLRKRCYENMQQINRRHPCRSVISTKFLRNFIEITLRHRCSPVNLLHLSEKFFIRAPKEGGLLQGRSTYLLSSKRNKR